MSLLRGGEGHGAAHAGALPSVSRQAPCPDRGIQGGPLTPYHGHGHGRGRKEMGSNNFFCESVISQKEAAERDWELAPDVDPSRKKRGRAEETAVRPSPLASAA